MLGEVLPYLEVQKENETDEEKKKEIEVPNIVGMTVEEAKKRLKEVGLTVELQTNEGNEINEKEVTITSQLPVGGIKIYEGSSVVVEIQ